MKSVFNQQDETKCVCAVIKAQQTWLRTSQKMTLTGPE